MGKMQRTKGAQYEREVCAEFTAHLATHIQRNIGQARDGGNDINVGPLRIECKRRKTLGTVESWMEQAEAACDRDEGHVPAAVGRQDGGQSLIIFRLEDFLALFAEPLQEMIDMPELPRSLRLGPDRPNIAELLDEIDEEE